MTNEAERPDRALSLLREAFEQDPDDLGEALEPVAMVTASWFLLLEIYERRVERSSEPGPAIAALVRIGTLHEEMLDDRERAISCYQRILDIDPDNALALGALERLAGVETPADEPAPPVDRETMERLTAGTPFRGPVPQPVKPPLEGLAQPVASSPAQPEPARRSVVLLFAVLFVSVVLIVITWLRF